MKLSRLLLPVGLLAGSAALAFAGPPSHLSIRPANTVKAPAVKAAAITAPTTVAATPAAAALANCATCACCKKAS